MQIGIVGLPKSGKTTVFNALTGGKAETAAGAQAAAAPNVGVVKVPDPRLETLTRMAKPRRTVPAEVTYVDIPGGGQRLGKGEGIGGQFLSDLSRVDELIHVVRAFADDTVPHVEGSVDPERDIATMNLELAFSDLAIIERRLQRLEAGLKGAKPQEREAIHREQELLGRIKSALEAETPVREMELAPEEARSIENFQFLTAKPLLTLVNIGEEQIPEAPAIEERLAGHRRPGFEVAALCGMLEMELSELEEADAETFRASVGLEEPGRGRVIRLSYGMLGLISFFTIGSDEVKAWTVRRDTPAARAAGKIHTHMERGFIRAEVVAYDDLVKWGSIAEVRKHGLLRLEGKTYPVQDGDVVTILFNV